MNTPTLRPTAFLVAGILALSACDQPRPTGKSASDAATEQVRPPRDPEPIAWDTASNTFVLNGKPLKTAKLWTFETGTDGFEGSGSTLAARPGGGLDVTGAVFDPIVRSPKDLSVKGAETNAVLVRLTRNKGAGRWDGSLFWTTLEHGEAAGFATKPIRGENPAIGETTLMVYDLSNPKKGGDDWVKSVITGLRLDLDDDAGGAFTIHQIAIVSLPADIAPLKTSKDAAN